MQPHRKRVRLGNLLVAEHVISEDQLQQALAQQKRGGHKLGRVLVELGFTSDGEIMTVLAEQLQLPVVDLRQFKFIPDTVRMLSESAARRYQAIVLVEDPDGLLLGMVDPTDIFAYDRLVATLKRPLKIALVREDELRQAIDTVYRRTDEIHSLAEELDEELSDNTFDLDSISGELGVADAPVVKLLQSVFEDAAQMHASDIHIEPEEKLIRIRQRIDGILNEQLIEETRIASALVTRLKLMAGLDIAEKRMPQDGRFNVRVMDRRIDVRVSTMPIQHGESVVMRLLDQSASLFALGQVGLPPDTLSRFRKVIRRQQGMVLVTGPTGSGKTTTLYAALNEINKPENKIITVEDPVEYRLPRINQVQINTKIDLSFSRVLRAALRQDPDVIMVGEMRDAETVEIGIRAAMTGHMVFSTLHTNDAIATVARLMDMGTEGYLLATALDAVVAQRLLRRICDSCSLSTQPDTRQMAWLENSVGPGWADADFMKGAGCAYCGNSGYRGRVGVYEFLEIDSDLREALRQNDISEFNRAASAQKGFSPLLHAAMDQVKLGLTTIDEVIRMSGEVTDLEFDNEVVGITMPPARKATAEANSTDPVDNGASE